jgi:F-box-like
MTSHSSNEETTDDPGAMNISAAATAIHPILADRQHILGVKALFTRTTLKEWVPCIPSPAQIQGYLEDTRERIRNIRTLDALRDQLLVNAQRDQLPASLQKLDRVNQVLFFTRLEYEIRFGRIFRINDLPPEILANIFHYIIWVSEGPVQSANWRLWLTWVCRHWRQIALSDPTLWNAIWFRDIPNFERSLAYLERTADAPLDIRINDSQERPLSLAEMQYLFQKLLKKISNLRIVFIVLQEWDLILFVLHAFCAVKERNLPMLLERFEMHRGGSPYVQIGAGHEHPNPIPLFGGATVPSFKYLTLNGIYIDWANSALTNLTKIDIRRIPQDKSPSLSQFRELFARSPALRELILDGAGPSWKTFVPGIQVKPIHIPSLRVLILGDFRLKFALYLCSHLSTPNVLDLTMIRFCGEEDYSKLYEALTSTMPLVRILTFYNIDFIPTRERANIMIKWLQSMPQVTYFRIGIVKPPVLDLFLHNPKTMGPLALHWQVDETPDGQTPDGQTPEPEAHTPDSEAQTLEEQIPKDSEQTIACPKLAFLELEFDDIDQFEMIIRWARIRKQFGSPIRKVYLKHSLVNKITLEQSQRLGAALDSGGTITFLNPSSKSVEEQMLMEEGEGIQ